MPFFTTSLHPTVSVVTIGNPLAAPSIKAFGSPSLYEGKHKISVFSRIFSTLSIQPSQSIISSFCQLIKVSFFYEVGFNGSTSPTNKNFKFKF